MGQLLFFSLQYPRWEFVYQPTYAAYLKKNWRAIVVALVAVFPGHEPLLSKQGLGDGVASARLLQA